MIDTQTNNKTDSGNSSSSSWPATCQVHRNYRSNTRIREASEWSSRIKIDYLHLQITFEGNNIQIKKKMSYDILRLCKLHLLFSRQVSHVAVTSLGLYLWEEVSWTPEERPGTADAHNWCLQTTGDERFKETSDCERGRSLWLTNKVTAGSQQAKLLIEQPSW